MPADLLDLLDAVEPEPVPPAAPRQLSNFVTPPAVIAGYVDKPPPTTQNHLCAEPGCQSWGSFGWMTARVEQSIWWCGKHVPAWFGRG